MVQCFDDVDKISPFMALGDDIYDFNWNKHMMLEPILDDDGKPTGEMKESETTCVFMSERYNYKPTMDRVLDKIFSSNQNASMEELKEMCEGLGVEPLEYLRKAMLEYITRYDTSSAVNEFSLNGTNVWLDRDTRVSLMNSTTIEKNSGKTNTTLWFGSMKIEVGVDKAITLLSALEMYALECYNKTAEHKNNVNSLTTVDEILAYDYTQGYPDKLVITTGFLTEE